MTDPIGLNLRRMKQEAQFLHLTMVIGGIGAGIVAGALLGAHAVRRLYDLTRFWPE